MGKAGIKNIQEHPFPDFIKPIGIYYVVCEDGVKSYALLEIEKGKEDEAFKFFNKRVANYLPVPGFGWREEILRTMEEAFPLIGMEAPQV
jgi:hypothetical protein